MLSEEKLPYDEEVKVHHSIYPNEGVDQLVYNEVSTK